MDTLRRHHDTPPAGMGGTYHDWLRYHQKEERRQRREERQLQALRSARQLERATEAARTRRKHRRRKERQKLLQDVLVAAVATGLLIGGTALKAATRTVR
jgi:ferric-dicitrate binding protein FerR (iron transport regulator)